MKLTNKLLWKLKKGVTNSISSLKGGEGGFSEGFTSSNK